MGTNQGDHKSKRKPYTQRAGACAFMRCKVVVGLSRFGEPPPTCEALVFGKDQVQHLVDMHGYAPGSMSEKQLAEVYVVVQADRNDPGNRPKGIGSATICECGEPRQPKGRACATCKTLEGEYHGTRPSTDGPPVTPEVRREWMAKKRREAKASCKCITCLIRETDGQHATCESCRQSAQRRYERRRDKAVQR